MKDGRHIDSMGTVFWVSKDHYHKTDGPAVVTPYGDQYWCCNGKLHREDGPAVIHPGGSECWYLKGLRHRIDGPAAVYSDGTEYWYIRGEKVDPMFALIHEVEKLGKTEGGTTYDQTETWEQT
jgi:hypothetical protein